MNPTAKNMSSLDGLTITLSISLCFLVALIFEIFHKIWWTPTRVQKLMASQGIRGPPYRLIDGNAKEVSSMGKEAMSRPLDLSHNILPAVLPHVHAWTKTYGKNYLQWHGTLAQLVVTEVELCKEILTNKNGAYLKPKFRGYAKKIFGNGLPALEGENWAQSRKLANHAFHGESLKNMIPDMIASAETMLDRWKNHEDGTEMEVYEEFRLFTSEVIARTAFGSSYGEGKNIFDMLMKLSLFKNELRLNIPGISKLFKTNDDMKSDKLEKGIRDSIMGIIKKREEKAVSGEEESFGSDFLGLLLKAHYDTNGIQRISVDDLVDECKSFYFVGQETSNTLLSWTVLLLALHTDWQEKAREEVLQLFGKQTPNPDCLTKLKTMSMIFNESLRLYSPAITVTRRVEKDVKLGKLIVPANAELIIPNLALHHDPQSWGADAQAFKPERFSEGIAKATNNNIATFLPFGMGPRICVGANFATIEAKIALSMILQRYSFTLSPGYVHLPLKHMTLRPQHGVPVMLHSL